jgi:geranylgeranyl reductase family protein
MKDIYDLVIVGAGPVGCKVGELVGKEHNTLIIDKKKEIGKPVQCTGFVSDRILELADISEKVILNKVSKASFFSPKGNSMTLKSKRPFYTIDRELFDKELADKAMENGVEIKLETEFKNFERKKDHLIINTSEGKFKSNLLVGADGPNSTVARLAKLPQPGNILAGVQETVKGSYDSDCCELWFGSKVCPDFFVWVAPESNEWARIGLATNQKAYHYLEKFIKKRTGSGSKTRDKVSGVIRYGLIEKSVADRILLVGDAACQLKPFSGGGLLYGLMGAHEASKTCNEALKEEKYSSEFLKKNYENVWKEKLRWPIIKGLSLKRTIHSLSDWMLDAGFSVGKYVGPIVEQVVDEDLL